MRGKNNKTTVQVTSLTSCHSIGKRDTTSRNVPALGEMAKKGTGYFRLPPKYRYICVVTSRQPLQQSPFSMTVVS